MPPPYDTNKLLAEAQAMLKQTAAEGTKPFAGSSFQTGQPITSESLAPKTPPNFQTAPQTPPPAGVPESLQSQIDAINAQFAAPLPQDAAITKERENVQSLISSLYGEQGEKATRAKLEADPALQAKRQQVQDLTGQANQLVAEAKGIQTIFSQAAEDTQNMGGSSFQVNANLLATDKAQRSKLLENSIKSLQVSSLLSAAQGNLSLALDQVDRAIKAEFEPKRNELEARRANLELLMSDPAIGREEKRRAAITQAKLNWEQTQIEKAEADKKSKLDLAAKLGSFGVDSSILTKIQSAKTFEEAFSIAAPYMQDPRAKQELLNAQLDYKMMQADLAYKQKQTALLGQPKEVAQEKLNLAKKNATVAAEIANDQVAVIDGLLNHPGMQYAVGPYEMQRQGDLIGIPGTFLGFGDSIPAMMNKGKTQEFIGAVGQLISQETMDTLLNLKKSGGTLGALSDSERIMLRNAASKIGAWEIEDPKTKQIVGYAVDEESFKRELRTLQTLARKAHQEAIGEFLGDDIMEIDQILEEPGDEDLMQYF